MGLGRIVYSGQFDDLPARMSAYAKEHGLVLSGQVYLQDEICIKDPSQYLVEVTVRVESKEV